MMRKFEVDEGGGYGVGTWIAIKRRIEGHILQIPFCNLERKKG